MSRTGRSSTARGLAASLVLGLGLAGCGPSADRSGTSPPANAPAAGAPDEPEELPPQGEAGTLFAKALSLETSDPAAATDIYVKLTLDHPNDLECGEGAYGGRCAEAARARIDVLACRKARGGKDPASPSVEALTAQIAAAAAAPEPAALVAVAACDFWFGACASDAGSSDAAGHVVPSLRDRLRASAGLEVIEASEDAARLATRTDKRGRTLELGLTREEGGWSWDTACESEPPPDVEP